MLVDPSLAFDESPAFEDLVLNRGIALMVGAVARIDARPERGLLVI